MNEPLFVQKRRQLASLLHELESKAALLKEVEKDCDQGEELLQPMRWECKQAELAFREAEQNPSWFGVFGYSKAEIDKRYQLAVDLRESYENAKAKLKALFEEREVLRNEAARLPAVRREYELLLQSEAKKLIPSLEGNTQATSPELQANEAALQEVQAVLDSCQKQLRLCLTWSARSDRTLLFSFRKELIELQKVWQQLMDGLSSLPEACKVNVLLDANSLKEIHVFGTSINHPDLSSAEKQYHAEIQYVRIRLEHAEKRLLQQNELLQAEFEKMKQRQLDWLTSVTESAVQQAHSQPNPYDVNP